MHRRLSSFAISLILLPLLTAAALAAADQLPGASSAGAGELQSAVDQARQSVKAPGLIIALRQPGGELQELASGMANVEQGVPLRPGDCFPVGSITKLFTAVMVLELADEGKLSLDDPLSKYQPRFPDGQAVTLRMLLSHSSGIWDYADLHLPIELVPLVASQSYAPQDIIDFVASKPVYFAPGSGFHYSNSNYIILGRIIEQVTGSTYDEQLHRRIIDKLGLTHTYFAGFDPLPSSALRGYALAGDQFRDRTAWENPSLAWSAGSIVSNAQDLAHFITALFDGELVSAASLAQMQQGRDTGFGGQYGLGLMMFDLPGGRAYGHSGETLSFSTELYIQPQSGMVLVVLANLAFCRTQDVARDVLQYVGMSDSAARRGIPERPSTAEQGRPYWSIGGAQQ